MPASLQAHESLQARIFAFEAMRSLAHERLHHDSALSPRLRERLAGGRDIGPEEYLEMRARVEQARSDVHALFADVDVLLYPVADAEAEPGLDYAGSPRYGALWTLWQLPCVSFPIGVGPRGLPLGAQLVGPFARDVKLLAAASHVHRLVANEHFPS